MKYRIEIDMLLDNRNDVLALMNLVEDIKSKSYTPKGDELIFVSQQCRYHECYHDEKPLRQCQDFTNVDFTGVKKQHI